MRDYAELVRAMRYCSEHDNCGSRCPRFEDNEDCVGRLTKDAADAIEELCSVLRDIASAAMIYDSEQACEVILRKLRRVGFVDVDEGGLWMLAGDEAHTMDEFMSGQEGDPLDGSL